MCIIKYSEIDEGLCAYNSPMYQMYNVRITTVILQCCGCVYLFFQENYSDAMLVNAVEVLDR